MSNSYQSHLHNVYQFAKRLVKYNSVFIAPEIDWGHFFSGSFSDGPCTRYTNRTVLIVTFKSIARITNTAHIIEACGIEWDSRTEVGGRKKQQHITTTNTSQCH